MKKTPLKKPTSFWRRQVKFDFKPLFLAVAKGTAHAATLKLDELGGDAAEAVASMGLDVPDDELAFVLIQRSLLSAMLTLAKESATHFEVKDSASEQLSTELERSLDGIDLEVGEDFIKAPAKLKLLKKIVPAFTQWLCDRGVSPQAAEVISVRLPSYFVFALAREWRKNAGKYKSLIALESSPFAAAEAYEHGWETYFAHLNKRVNENVFDEPFSLAQIYVALNAYCVVPKSEDGGKTFKRSSERVVVNLDTELRTWLKKGNKHDAIRVLSGGPGSGKSSFTRMLCARLANDGVAKPVYIPLHLLDPTREVAAEVDRFVRDEGLLGFNPLDQARGEENLLLVFDGLDELASQGKIAAQVTRDFVRAVEKMVERRNSGQHPIFVILSGRELVIQENETEFRQPRQILSLLPYFVARGERAIYSDPDKLLNTDLRNDWWRGYGKLTGVAYAVMPEPLAGGEIGEVTAQPLLNYLVALSYRRGKLDFGQTVDLNRIYEDLVAAVHERGYENRRTYAPISHLKLKDFCRVLEEIALAAWHGSDGRSTSVRDIMEHCHQSGITALLTSFTEGAEAGVTKLLAAFFFRRNGESAGDDAAFVFTHKSFGEYLTAARLVRGMERISVERGRRRKDTDDGIDVPDALSSWTRLTGPAEVTEYVQAFLLREIANRDQEVVSSWLETFEELTAFAIDSHSPIEKLGVSPFSTAYRYDVNASASLLIALNGCARALKRVAHMKFSSTNTFGSFLRRVTPQRIGPANPPVYSALSFLDLSGQCIDMADFYGADLTRTLFRGSFIHFGNFSRANLLLTDFTGARISWSRFAETSLRGTIFSGAEVADSNFQESMADGCSFKKAKLGKSEFFDATLEKCDFRGAILIKAKIHDVREVIDSDFANAMVIRKSAAGRWLTKQAAIGKVRGTPKFVEGDGPFPIDEDVGED